MLAIKDVFVAQEKPVLRPARLRFSTRICVVLFMVLVLTVCLEVASRCYWAGVQKVAPSHDAIWRFFFPEVAESGIDDVAPDHRDGSFDVLLLGPSVMHPAFGDIGVRLQAELEQRLRRPVRVINLAYMGRTTRDSLIVYEHFADRRFDLVIVYHGINDVALNTCPPGSFREDYTHATRFAQVAALERRRELDWLALPFTGYYVGSSVLSRWHLTNNPRNDYNPFGSDIRTPPAVERNLEAIAALARERGDSLLLMTFAWYMPVDYSDKAFAARTLDYDNHAMATSTWGEPANVVRTLDLHNEAIRRVASRCQVQLIDQQALMPPGKRHFNDICHLTPQGCACFVNNIVTNTDWRQVGRR